MNNESTKETFFECPFDGYKAKKKEHLVMHVISTHGNTTVEHRCPRCNEVIEEGHLKRIILDYQCPFCDFNCDTMKEMIKHVGKENHL